MATTKYVLFYKPDPDAGAKAAEFRAAHFAHFQEFHRQGKILSFGPFANLIAHGSMGVFDSKDHAEEFVAKDPFHVNGIVKSHEIREWTDVLN